MACYLPHARSGYGYFSYVFGILLDTICLYKAAFDVRML